MHPKSPNKPPAQGHPWRDAFLVFVMHRYFRFALIALLLIAYLTMSSSYRAAPKRGTDNGGSSFSSDPGLNLPTEVQSTTKDANTAAVLASAPPRRSPVTSPPKDTTETDSPPSEELTGYNSYLPRRHPILDPKAVRPNKDKPVQVQWFTGPVSSYSRYFLGGVERSVYTKLTSVTVLGNHTNDEIDVIQTNSIRSDLPSVWMVDFSSIDQDCHSLEYLIRKGLESQQDKTDIILVIIDMSGSSGRVHCPRIEKWIPRNRIRLVHRGIVRNRHWDEEQKWVNVGEVAPNIGTIISAAPVIHAAYVVREGMVDIIRALLASSKTIRSTKNKSPVDINRSVDVAHFWRMGDYSHYAFLRRQVSKVLQSMEETRAGKRKVHTLVEKFGTDELMEENAIQQEYVEQLLSAKIIVVAQRDEWEDHVRLFDSLVGGAMVMTDAMLGLPEGLEHEKNIVVYDSAKSLEEYIRYYLDPKNDKKRLEIAQRGWELATGRHRSWHRVEQLLFGEPSSHVDKYYEPGPPKRKRKATS